MTLYNLDRTHPASSWVKPFLLFLSQMKITTKDSTEPGPIIPFDSQLMFLSEVCDGLENGCHYFTNLKARQLGISTILLALDIFWLSRFPRMVGAFIADTDENVQIFRATIVEMLDSLPDAWKIGVHRHNRYELTLKNGSRLQYMRGGGTKNDKLGRSRGLSFIHATEIGRWQDQKAVDSLIDSLATENPNRLYMFESTALGAGIWQDMYENAKSDGVAQKAFFIGWWSKRLYRYEAGTELFERWWNENPDHTPYEDLVTRIIETQYGYTITPEQWAWYRHRQSGRSIESMREEMPSVAEEAFQFSGKSFFNLAAVAKDRALLRTANVTFDAYRYKFGIKLLDLDIQHTSDLDTAQLKVWERPIRGARYVMGIDPAYCSNPDSDDAVISLWRCYSDKLVQTAEFAANDVQTNHLAWVICHLAGQYGDVRFNLEINGPGQDVFRQLKDIRLQIALGQIDEPLDTEGWLKASLKKATWYVYTRDDSVFSGGGAYNSLTNGKVKEQWLNQLRSLYSQEELIVRSDDLLDEFKTLRQEDGTIKASGRNNDDRVMAAALAAEAYYKHIRTGMIAEKRTFLAEQARQVADTDGNGQLKADETTLYDDFIPRFLERKRTEAQQARVEALRRSVMRQR